MPGFSLLKGILTHQITQLILVNFSTYAINFFQIT